MFAVSLCAEIGVVFLGEQAGPVKGGRPLEVQAANHTGDMVQLKKRDDREDARHGSRDE
jgi:hypothetical protein